MRTFSISATVEAETLDGAIAALAAMLEKATVGAPAPDTSGRVTQCTITKSGAWTFDHGLTTGSRIYVSQ
jgi:predicted RNA-binding protein with PIN domain